MSQYTQAQIAQFLDRKADQYPGLDLHNQVPKQDRLHRFV